MTTERLVFSTWELHPGVLAASLVLALVYLTATRCRLTPRALLFFAGLSLLILVPSSPLALLGRRYLFSAHMIEHLLFVLVIPALCLLGLPPTAFAAVARNPAARRLGHPLVTWLCGGMAMWLWHWPPLYGLALRASAVHLAEQISLLLLGAAFWWPVIAPPEHSRLDPLLGVVYLFTGCVGCTVLGILITFAPGGLYPVYLAPPDPLGILPLVRDGWGFPPAVDQEVGGLLMWIPACLIYLTGIITVLARWYGAPESGTREAPLLPHRGGEVPLPMR